MRNFYLLLILLLVLFLALPLALGENSFLIVIDNLDSDFVYLQVLKLSGLLFSTSADVPVESVMNGLPRNYFHSEFNVIRVLFALLPALYAYIMNGAIVRIVAFYGMFLLSNDVLLKEKSGYAPWLAFLFACIPFYTIYGISVAGLPLLLWAFLQLKNDPRKYVAWMVVMVFPFYAHFALVGPFIILFFFAYGVYCFVNERKAYYGYWVGIFLLCAFFVLSNGNLIASFFFNKIHSHRSTWNLPVHTWSDVIGEIAKIVMRGHYHAGSFFAIPIYVLIGSGIYNSISKKKKDKRLIVVITLVFAFSIIYPAYSFLRYQLKDSLPILMSFQFNRFIFLIPLMWFVGVAIAVETSSWKKIYIQGLLFIQLGLIVYSNNELKMNVLHAAGINTKGLYFDQPSFKQFFEPDLLSEVERYIGRPKSSYRVVSLGLHPGVAQYSGFYTLDSYQNNYPLAYKQKFRKIISGELEKDETLRMFFDDWGSRCYLYSAELWKRCKVTFEKLKKTEDNSVKELDIDVEQLRQLGGEYILSAVPIRNDEALGLTLEKTFSHPDSGFDIYLYKVPVR